MKANAQIFVDILLNSEGVPKPEEPDVGEIEKISPDEFKLISSIITLCERISDTQVNNYINYINNAMKNSGEFERFLDLSREMKTTVMQEEFV